MKQFWKTFLLWSALNAGITTLPMVALPLLATSGPDIDGMQLMAAVAGLGVALGVALVVFPTALLTTKRFEHHSNSWIFIPYVAMIPYAVAIMATTGIFFIPPLVLQLIVAVTLHVVIARRLRRTSAESAPRANVYRAGSMIAAKTPAAALIESYVKHSCSSSSSETPSMGSSWIRRGTWSGLNAAVISSLKVPQRLRTIRGTTSSEAGA